MKVNTISEILDDLQQGKMVIIIDDEDRENEGDLVMMAEHVTPDAINFMARYGRGLICLALDEARCDFLRLPLMVRDNHMAAAYSTNFTLSIDAASGVTTGISAADRAHTIKTAVDKNATAEDLVQPGHVFPLKARVGGVLVRAGHTEAGCDLAALAGGESCAVIVEILNEDGNMARRADLEKFSEIHQLKITTIADLISYRLENEVTINQLSQCHLPTDFGDFQLCSFEDTIDAQIHLAVVAGKITADQETLVRVHVADPLIDLFAANRGDVRWPLAMVMRQIQLHQPGVLVVLRQPDQNERLAMKVDSYQKQDEAKPDVMVQEPTWDGRAFGLAAQILADLGVSKMRVIGTPTRLIGLSGFGLELVGYFDGSE